MNPATVVGSPQIEDIYTLKFDQLSRANRIANKSNIKILLYSIRNQFYKKNIFNLYIVCLLLFF